ncbi:phage tail length tape measure family protein [Luteimonas fraxinea]|uniref:Phage tail length tape measure family protein n=1 Tax=Luteimonas fraxinea TaxID=2901869 RepID=A0ABS8UBF9_9GAMM|nr:phage tail length tape measure family protein [Luteimonas fraxinea]MCD9096200.1 phage tail length tape measure family protein [Luteimonas fraxinea]
MDVAQLGYEVDSSGLERGTRALDDNTRAAERTATATETLESRYQAIARRGVEYAESTRGANLSDRALAEAAREAAAGIDTKAQVMARAGSEQERIARRVEAMRLAEERLTAQQQQAARASKAQEINLKQLLGQIDPTIAKLDRLAEAEGRLEQAFDMGLINPQVFDQYQSKLDAARAATLNVGKASDIATNSIGNLNLQAVETQQSIAALARAVVTGQWGQAQSSITSLTARTGMLGAAGLGTTAVIGGLVAGFGAFAIMAGKGYIEARRMEGVIIGLGGAADVTTGDMLDLRNEIGRTTGDYASATQAVNQLLLSGKATGDMLDSMAMSASNLAMLTGQSVSSTTSEITTLADGGAEAIEKWMQKYGLLTAETYLHIESIRRQKGETAALTAVLEEAERVSGERVQQMKTQAGMLEAAWVGVTNAIKGALQELKDYGRSDINRQIIEAQRALNRAGGPGGAPGEAAMRQRILDDLIRQRDAQDAANTSQLDYLKSARASERELESARTAAAQKRTEDEAKAESDIERQLQSVYGLDTAVNRLEMSFAGMSEERQKAMVADGRYTALLNRAMEEDAKRNERRTRVAKVQLTEEEKSEARLQQQYSNSEASLTRQIALYGDSSRAAAMAYDIKAAGLDKLNPKLATANQELAQWLDWLDEMSTLDDAWDGISEGYKRNTDTISEYAKQAARNMQSSFANFLFDPFAEGSRGMLKGFSDTIRRMAAEAASTKFFEMIGGAMSAYSGTGSGWINAVGGMFQANGKREYGGPVSRSGMYQVGERNKPEILSTPNGQYLIPGDSGRVDPIRAAPAGRGGAGVVSVKVEMINQGGQVETRSQQARQMPDGTVLVKLINDVVGDSFASGTGAPYASAKNRFGLKDAV